MKLKENEYTIQSMRPILHKSADPIIRMIKVFQIQPIEMKYNRIPIYSQECLDKLKWYFENGKSIKQIADKFETSPYKVRTFLKEYNLFNDDFVNGYVLTDEQYNDLSNWLKISSFEKQQASFIKNYGSIENYKKEMVANMQKTTEEKYKKLYGDNWKIEIFYNRPMKTIIERFGSEEAFVEYNRQKSKERWENMTDEEKQDMKERMIEGNERKHGNKWYNNNAKCRETKQERYGDEFYNNSEQATKTTIDRYKTKNVSHKYFYDDIWFDSSWEVQYYEYLKKNNINFKYHPCRIKMENGRYYEPDFLLVDDNQLVEIKNSFYVDENGKLRDFAKSKTKTHIYKQKCMEENNVLVIIDIEPYRQFTDWEMKQLRKSSKILLDKKKEERRKNKSKKMT